MIERLIKEHFDLHCTEVEALNTGTTSNVYKITASKKEFVLKSNISKSLAEAEFICLKILSQEGLAPEPLKTAAGEMIIQIENDFYFLMNYLESIPSIKNDIDFELLGSTVRQMHQILKQLDIPRRDDRFNEQEMAGQIENNALRQEINEYLSRNTYFKESSRSLIHGDLGSWNILYSPHGIKFIDFADVRPGSPYFDLAAIIESFNLNHAETESLMKGYDRNASYQLMLNTAHKKWRIRGILFMASNQLLSNEQLLKMVKSL
ncbi:phosphotransferase enzyme family protein [Corticicoccus populi]|uniref:Phosphotransferase enzyme family protein n=1 Tax=Corticicoccus populi TaxID=1812821 RepID=A0ABW5WXX0_9STAP